MGGTMGSLALWFFFNPPFLIATVPFYASIALIVIFILYEVSIQVINLVFADWRAKNDFGAVNENLKHANERVYNAPVEDDIKRINEKMNRYKKDLSYANLIEHFGHYQELSGVLFRLNRQIEIARQNRDRRDELYRDIAEGADFKALLNYFDELRGSETAIRARIAKKEAESRDLRLRWWIGVSLTVIALVTVVLSVQNTLS